MRVLFICKHNRFRSKIAEALFKKYNKNKKIKVESCAVNPDYIRVAESVVNVLKKFGVRGVNRHPKKINKRMIDKADLIVIVADNIKRKFKGKKVIVWKISDVRQGEIKEILKRAKLIEKRIKRLISMLNHARIA